MTHIEGPIVRRQREVCVTADSEQTGADRVFHYVAVGSGVVGAGVALWMKPTIVGFLLIVAVCVAFDVAAKVALRWLATRRTTT